jgi:hypothetical protein
MVPLGRNDGLAEHPATVKWPLPDVSVRAALTAAPRAHGCAYVGQYELLDVRAHWAWMPGHAGHNMHTQRTQSAAVCSMQTTTPFFVEGTKACKVNCLPMPDRSSLASFLFTHTLRGV